MGVTKTTKMRGKLFSRNSQSKIPKHAGSFMILLYNLFCASTNFVDFIESEWKFLIFHRIPEVCMEMMRNGLIRENTMCCDNSDLDIYVRTLFQS